jgi:hypothetical protein
MVLKVPPDGEIEFPFHQRRAADAARDSVCHPEGHAAIHVQGVGVARGATSGLALPIPAARICASGMPRFASSKRPG